MGYFCREGDGVTKDIVEAIRWFQIAAAQGNADAQCSLGSMYYFKPRIFILYPGYLFYTPDIYFKPRIFIYTPDIYFIPRKFILTPGYRYAKGQGVEKSDAEAYKWYQLAADRGEKFAQSNLAACYQAGRAVVQSNDEAFKYYRMSALQKHSNGEYGMGSCYVNGWGVGKSEEEAIKWYRLAAAQGHSSALKELAKRGL